MNVPLSGKAWRREHRCLFPVDHYTAREADDVSPIALKDVFVFEE